MDIVSYLLGKKAGTGNDGITIDSGSNEHGFYMKFSNGDIIQYGYAEAPASTTYATITFPIEFNDTNYEVLACHKYQSGEDYGGSAQLRCVVTGQASTKAIGYAYSVLSDGTAPAYIRKCSFIAIGKWK